MPFEDCVVLDGNRSAGKRESGAAQTAPFFIADKSVEKSSKKGKIGIDKGD